MAEPLRRTVVVETDGRIVLHVPQLKPGTHAEVTLVEQISPERSPPSKRCLLPV